MVISTKELLKQYSNYSVPKMKIKREVDKGTFYVVKKGLYETDRTTPGYLLSQYIKSPSYLSFEYALSIYGIIPERVVEFSCATTNQKHSFVFTNQFGRYSYRDIPNTVFYLETIYKEESGYSYLIASKEKAICDYLYILSPTYSKKKLYSLLFESLRFDLDEFAKLNIDMMIELSKMYKTTNHKYFIKLLEDFKNGKHYTKKN